MKTASRVGMTAVVALTGSTGAPQGEAAAAR